LAQLAGVLVVFIYAGGFLALSLHHASFGISQFNLLRPKILSAGVLFLVFATLPVIETMQIIGSRVALVKASGTEVSALQPDSHLHWTTLLEILLIVFVGSSMVLRPFLSDPSFSNPFYRWSLAAVIPSSAIWPATLILLRRSRRWQLASQYVLLFLSIPWMAFCIYRTRDATSAVLIGWFIFCSYIFYLLRGAFRDVAGLSNINWTQAVTMAMATGIFFGVQVYPRIPAGFGGGSPTQATLQFVDKSPFDGTLKSRVWFIDENDLGFYVIRSKDAKKAIFLPRNTIAAIYFGEELEESRVDPSKKGPAQDAPSVRP
jgi:hypothetical protein